MSYYNIIPDALEYYDKCKEETESLLSKKSYDVDWHINENNLENDSIRFVDKDGHIINEFYYELIGYYYDDYDTWIWGWAYPSNPKKTTHLIRKVLTYGLNMEITDNNPEMILLKTALINSRIKLNDSFLQCEILNAIVLYLSKTKYIFQYLQYPLYRSFYILFPIEQ